MPSCLTEFCRFFLADFSALNVSSPFLQVVMACSVLMQVVLSCARLIFMAGFDFLRYGHDFGRVSTDFFFVSGPPSVLRILFSPDLRPRSDRAAPFKGPRDQPRFLGCFNGFFFKNNKVTVFFILF